VHSAHTAFVCFVRISEQRATLGLYSIKRLVLYNRGLQCLLDGTHCLCKTVRLGLEICCFPQFLLANALLVVQIVRVNCATCLSSCLAADGSYSCSLPRCCLSVAVFCDCGDSWR
jgi:hypothetical protein